jgi:hypothetical protein
VEVALTVPGRIPLDIRLALNGSRKALEELFIMLAQCARSDEIEVTGGTRAWSFTQNGTTVHLVVDGE